MLQAHGKQNGHGVSESLDAASRLGLLHENLSGAPVVIEPDGDVTFGFANGVFVSDGLPGFRKLLPERNRGYLIGRVRLGIRVFLRFVLSGLDRRDTLGTVPIDRDSLQSHLP